MVIANAETRHNRRLHASQHHIPARGNSIRRERFPRGSAPHEFVIDR
jgi:hypothetical protein